MPCSRIDKGNAGWGSSYFYSHIQDKWAMLTDDWLEMGTLDNVSKLPNSRLDLMDSINATVFGSSEIHMNGVVWNNTDTFIIAGRNQTIAHDSKQRIYKWMGIGIPAPVIYEENGFPDNVFGDMGPFVCWSPYDDLFYFINSYDGSFKSVTSGGVPSPIMDLPAAFDMDWEPYRIDKATTNTNAIFAADDGGIWFMYHEPLPASTADPVTHNLQAVLHRYHPDNPIDAPCDTLYVDYGVSVTIQTGQPDNVHWRFGILGVVGNKVLIPFAEPAPTIAFPERMRYGIRLVSPDMVTVEETCLHRDVYTDEPFGTGATEALAQWWLCEGGQNPLPFANRFQANRFIIDDDPPPAPPIPPFVDDPYMIEHYDISITTYPEDGEIPPLRQRQRDDSFNSPRQADRYNGASSIQEGIRSGGERYL